MIAGVYQALGSCPLGWVFVLPPIIQGGAAELVAVLIAAAIDRTRRAAIPD